MLDLPHQDQQRQSERDPSRSGRPLCKVPGRVLRQAHLWTHSYVPDVSLGAFLRTATEHSTWLETPLTQLAGRGGLLFLSLSTYSCFCGSSMASTLHWRHLFGEVNWLVLVGSVWAVQAGSDTPLVATVVKRVYCTRGFWCIGPAFRPYLLSCKYHFGGSVEDTALER